MHCVFHTSSLRTLRRLKLWKQDRNQSLTCVVIKEMLLQDSTRHSILKSVSPNSSVGFLEGGKIVLKFEIKGCFFKGVGPLNFPGGYTGEEMHRFKKFGCYENRKLWPF